eukprot:6476282-Amphidinium_carterae.1
MLLGSMWLGHGLLRSYVSDTGGRRSGTTWQSAWEAPSVLQDVVDLDCVMRSRRSCCSRLEKSRPLMCANVEGVLEVGLFGLILSCLCGLPSDGVVVVNKWWVEVEVDEEWLMWEWQVTDRSS